VVGLRSALGVVAVLVAGWLLLVLLTALFQRQLIYLPGNAAAPTPPDDVEPVTLHTGDGLELTSWFLSAPDAVSTVLVTPGNAGDRELRLPLARGLVDRGHAVLLLEYRGYGGNPGSPSEDGLVADARAARRHLDGRDDVDAGAIAYLGESVGTGVAAALAAEAPPAALVLRSPFPELADVGRSAYPFLPVGALLRDRFPVAEHLERYDGPVLVVAGGADTIVPTALSREVAERADAELVVVPGVGHNDRELLAGQRFLDAVDRHVRAAVEGRS
jgi:pimeloyl-ACP methyl ester carboxylesterase